MHRKICNLILIAGLMLPSSLAWAQTKVYSQSPTGEGDPMAITCRPPQVLPGSRLLGPEVCKTNQVWARYAKDGMAVAADGIHDVPSEKTRSTHPMFCRPATPGGGNTSGMNAMIVGTVCE